MAMNPMKLMQLASAWKRFTTGHPKVVPFFQAVQSRAISEGTIIRMKVTTADGTDLMSSIRLSKEDIELFQQLKETMDNT